MGNKDLLKLEQKNAASSSLESALLFCQKDSVSQIQKPSGKLVTAPVPTSQGVVDEKTQHPGNLPRTYTLTHSDITSMLTLAISQTINGSQFQGWYSKLQRDEVVAEWKKVKGKMSLHVHCHISGGHFLLNLFAKLRFYIFCRELPVVLIAFVHGDGNLFQNYPELEEALVWVYFHSNLPEFNRVECWGPLKDATAPSNDGGMLLHRDQIPSNDVIGKVKDFLGIMAEANKRLQQDSNEKSSKDYDIEILSGNEKEIIEMDLVLGVADLNTPEAVAAAESALAGSQPVAPMAGSSSSESDTESSSDDEDDDDNDDEACKQKDPQVSKSDKNGFLSKPIIKRQKIIELL